MFIGEESSKRRVNACIPKYISMAYYIMFLWIPGRDGIRSKVTGNFLVNALHAFYRFNRRYHDKNKSASLITFLRHLVEYINKESCFEV